MRIAKVGCDFEREPLAAPFGFKGGYLSELWQSVVRLESPSGKVGLGLGTQSVLWSDAGVFTADSEAAGNARMFLITAFAAKAAVGLEWETPIDLMERLLPAALAYGKTVTRNEALRLTFVLNALVAVDNAAWSLYCREKNIASFDDMVPLPYRAALTCRHEKLAAIPLMSYNVPLADIVKAVKSGYFFLKIKIGADPDKDGDLDKTLEWDTRRLTEIHEAVKDIRTPYTESGRVPYYLDANGRYDTLERLAELLRRADKIGALERIILLEEPFAEENKLHVAGVPARLAADESAHSDADALERIELGYGAIALKPIAKTMSMSLKIARAAAERNVSCFCADLTVNPILVDWNKNVACRLAALPGMKVGALESNGHQNYKNWKKMLRYHPAAGATWIGAKKGLFACDASFYERSGGVFELSEHYLSLVKS